jgi:5'-nucleotidase
LYNRLLSNFIPGIAAAVMSLQPINSPSETQLRIAFDLDAVLFSDESDRIYKEKGLQAFIEHETEKREIPLPEVCFSDSEKHWFRMQFEIDSNKLVFKELQNCMCATL